jgi:RimJ/RimL family protein N-acetyltransferase
MILRAANELDAQRLFEWRNDPLTRANSSNTDLVTWTDHTRWLSRTLRRPDRDLLIAERDGQPLGTIRIDYLADSCELSWTVAPEYRQQGLGKQMVRLAILVARVPDLTATIKPDNEPSEHIVRALGFTQSSHRNGLAVWRYARSAGLDLP